MDNGVQASVAGVRRSFPHLPEDIWLQIASKLSTRDWARASGACAALRGMLLNDIMFVAEHVLGRQKSPLLWLHSRLHAAQAAQVDIKTFSPERKVHQAADQDYLMHEVLLRITKTALDAQVPEGDRQMALSLLLLTCDDAPSFCQGTDCCLEQLLRRAGTVHVLYMFVEIAPALPQMANLKHLILNIQPEGSKKAALKSLQHLPRLETLKLGSNRQWRSARSLVLPPSVKFLFLDDAVTKDLSVPQACRVAVKGALHLIEPAINGRAFRPTLVGSLETLSMEASGWCNQARDHVRSVTFELPATRFARFSGSEILRCWQNIEMLAIYWEGNDVLLGPLSRMQHLVAMHITAAHLVTEIPATVQLVHFEARYLQVGFADPVASAKHMRYLQWTYRDFDQLTTLETNVTPLEIFEHGLATRQMALSFDQAETSRGVMTTRGVSETGDLSCWDEVCGCRCCSYCLKLPEVGGDEASFEWFNISCANPLAA